MGKKKQYQTAEDWLKQNDQYRTDSSSSNGYQTAEEWLNQNQARLNAQHNSVSRQIESYREKLRREQEEQQAAEVKKQINLGELLMGSGKDYQDAMGRINRAGEIATGSLLKNLFGAESQLRQAGRAARETAESLEIVRGKDAPEPAAEKDPAAEYFTGLLGTNSWAQESNDSAVPNRGMGRYSNSTPGSKEKRIEITDLESAKEEREAAYLEYQKAEENYYAVPDGDFQKAQDDYLAADARLQKAESRVKQLEQDLQAQEDEDTYNKYKAMIASLSEKEFEALLASNDQDDTMSYGYLLKQGYSRYDINAMYETLLRGLNAEMSENVLGSVYDFAGQNFGTGAVGFAGARAGQFLGGFTGTAQVILDTAKHYFQGSPYHGTDPNGPGYLPSRAAAAADQGVSDAIEGEDGGFVRQAAAFVYRGAANAADNLVRMAIASATGGGSYAGAKINSALSFTQGFQGSYREAQEKGGSPIQGFLVGSVDGGMEVFTESRTFERWMHLKDPELIGKDAFAWLKSAAIGTGNEMTEEEASYIANTIADAVVMANKSDSAQFIKAAVADGKTQAEAWWELVKKYAHEMAVTAEDTAMSTLLMDAGTGVVANYQENRLYKKNYGEVAQELVQEGLESPEGTKSRNLAEQYQKKLDAGKQLSGSELRRLVNANEEQFAKEETDTGSEVDTEQAGDAGKSADATKEIKETTSDGLPDLDVNQKEEIVADSEMETTRSEPEKSVTLESLSEKYGPYAEAMRRNYLEGQDAEEYDREFQIAYDMGKSGLNKDALNRVEAIRGLSQSQREIAYEIGQAAAAAQAKAQSAENAKAANGKTGWHKGVVMGKGVKIADLVKTFNDPQRKAYSALRTIAEATGIDIVLYKSEANEDGALPPVQGTFVWSENTIYIDVDAGLSTIKDVGSLAKYTMLRTYGHEFTHFIEKWNPEQYNEFRKAVFETMKKPEDLIETVLSQDSTGKMSYDDASREVVAQAMTDILEDSQFIQQLADKHRSVFETLRSKLKEFVENLKSYFNSLAKNGLREARLLKQEVGDSISYLEGIVKQFDEIAVQAVENYQKTVAEDESATVSETEMVEDSTKTESKTVSESKVESKQAKNDSIQEDSVLNNRTEKQTDSSPTDLYSHIAVNALHLSDGYRLNGFAYNIREESDGSFLATIQRYTDIGGIPAYDGHYLYKETFATAEEAMESITAVARYNKLGEFKQEENTKKESRNDLVDEKYGFTIHDNTERGTIEISFTEKPDADVLDILKQNKFRWSKTNKLWYGKGNREEMAEIIRSAVDGTGGFSASAVKQMLDDPERERAAEKMLAQADKVNEDFENSIGTTDNTTTEQPEMQNEDSTKSNPVGTFSFLYNRIAPKMSTFELDGKGRFTIYDDGTLDILKDSMSGANTLEGFRNQGMMDLYDIYFDGQKWTQGKDMPTGYYRIERVTQKPTVKKAPTGGYAIYQKGVMRLVDISKVQNAENNQLPDKPAGNNTEEVTPNAETDVRGQEESNGALREDHQGGIPESEQPGEGNPRLLDEVEAEPVQQHEQGGAAGVPGERGAEAGRSGGRFDSERDGRSGGAGSGAVSDLRRDADVNQDDGGIAETVQREIEQKSTEKPKGENYSIGESLNLANGEKARYRDNVAALRLIHQLNQEGRFATREEQEVLSRYVGWGGLDGAFGELAYNREARKNEMRAKSGWEKEFQELRQLVTDGIISEEEYRGMSESTKNAHYTSMEVISAMYDGLKKLGFQGGRMLEPSSGVGNFVGGMPADMTASVKSWTMVELDRVTGQIAKYLYPNNDVRIEGFQDANIPNDYMDVAIGNVPFGNYGVVDRSYPKRVTKSIHNYFFAKSIDKVRPGGLVMFITSSFTMNSQDNAIRQYIMDRADLMGAIRLPNTAFKGNAGTDVVTDILILKKRIPGTAYSGETFLEAPQKSIPGSWRMANVNEYFSNHPEMVLGKETVTRGMYGAETLTYSPLEGAGSLGDQIRAAFDKITGKMDYSQKTAESVQKAAEKAVRKPKEGAYRRAQDGTITNGSGVAVTNADTAKRIGGMIDIRDAYRNLVERIQQGRTKEEIAKARKYLNQVYDSFVKENGLINDPKNKKAFEEDPYRYSLYALETDYQKGGKGKPATAKKADIFTKDTIKANVTVTHAESVSDGLIVSINTTGGVDASLIARLTGRSKEEVTRELIDSRMAFKTRSGGLEAPETYLSGNVRAKLREAEALARNDKDFQNNVEELRRVIPKDVPYDEIHVSPGAVWVPTDVYADFIAHMLGGRNNGYGGPDVEVGYSAQTGEYKIRLNNARLKGNYHNTQEWGTSRRSFLDLFESLLGNGNVTVTDREIDANGKERRVVNKDETAAAQEKADKIKEEFRNWIWSDETRRTELAKLYNETYNALANPKYDGSSLTVNGLNATFSLREHQANAVKRIISSGGNTLLAHRVGAGKTLEMAAAAMKLRELGIVKKPVFAVPKSLVAQWGVEFSSYFPAAKLLVADDKSFSKENRKVFTNNIANGDFDAVILSYEQFGKIPMSKEYQQRFLQEQIDEVLTAIAEEKAENGGKSLTVKQMEKKVAQLKTKLERLKIQSVDEDNVDFESLGIDALFVDEAHNFKNLQYTTKMQNVGGLGNSDGSQRAFDLYTKVRYLQQLNGGRGIVFATATPVMNSMAEMYIMQKYLQSDMLKQLGITTFDAWAKQFGEVVNTYEIKPSGQGVRAKQVFSNFKNLNELQLMFRSFSDVLTEVPGLKIPKMRGGGVQIVECEPGKFQKEYMKSLEKRANNVKNVDPSEDNMLKITSDGRKVSYTQRMIDPTLPYEPGCKLYRCCENILKEYRDGKNIKTVDGKTGKTVTINGTQIVFCDMATPKGKDKSKANDDVSTEVDDSFDAESARLYEDMRDYLAKKGIPREEIAFIHEADTDLKRKQLFADMNAGKVRVLIGSTGKMGVGMNAQRCVTAIHHLDAPWRPGDVEQRDGRAFRQGNLNDEVAKYVYVTTGSFDARLWDILDRKSGFINQIMNGDDVGRNAEDTGDVTLSAAEVKALASGNPMIKESVELADELQKLNSLKRTHDSAVIRARTNLQNDIKAIAALEMSIEARKADLKKRTDTYSEEKFSMQIGGKTFSDRKDAGEALLSAILSKAKTENEYAEIGSFAGFQILAAKSQGEYEGVLRGSFRYGFKVHLNNPTLMTGQMAKKIAGLESELKAQEERLAQTITDKAAQERLIAQPFERQAELDEKRRRYDFVMSELNKTDQQYGSDDMEQHQRRTETLTDRDVLSMAADKILSSDAISMDAAESDALDIFKKRLSTLDSLQERRRELGKTYRELQFGANVDRVKAAETLKQMRELDAKIQEAESKVIAAETAPALRKILPVARRIVENKQKEQDDAVLQRWRDRRNNAASIKKYRDRISKDVADLSNWILSPSNKTDMKHVPDVLKNTVIEFINSIDFTSKRQLNGGEATKADTAFMNRLTALQMVLDKNAEDTGLYSGYNDLPPDFQEKLKGFIASAQAIVNAKSGQSVINQMTSQELKSLSEIVKAVKKLVQDFNRFHSNAVYQHVSEAGDATIRELNEYKDAKSRTKAGEGINNFVFWNQIRPAYAFERFGNGGKAIYDGLRRGQAQLAFDTKEIVSFSEKAYTEKEVTEWDKEVKTIQLKEGTVKMRVSQIMSFYELLKREQAKGHIFGQGIRISTFLANGKKVSDTGHTISIEDANRIIAELTPRQIEVADALQKFMQEKGGSWGNYVSVKRFGEKQFGEENYFPINSDGRHIEAAADEKMEGQSLYALLNMSFTKKLQEKANNRIVVYSIFDVFSNHMASMAQYHSFALPVLDALKWFNYQQKEKVTVIENGQERVRNQVVDSVRDQLDRVYGVPEETKPGAGRRGYAENFIIGILKAFNGTESHGVSSDEIGLNSLRRFNMAQVAYNFRVVIQQPMAITRAAMVIDYGSIIRGLKLSPKAIRSNIEEMNRYSGIAAWKDLGFYDTNISRGLTDIIKHKKTGMEKFREAGMWGAEKADQLTWAAMWSACKEEVQRKYGIMPGSEHFYDAVSSLFEEVVYKTQVVDSVLTKNEYLRSKGLFARATGSFMSEPTTTASMLADAFDKYRMDLQRKDGNHRDAWRKNGKRIGRTLYVYAISQVILAAVQAVSDAFRDDDEYEEFGEKWMEAFIGNVIDELNPFNKLPLVTEFCDLAKNLLSAVGVDTYGYAPSSIWLQWADDLVKGTQILHQKIFGDGNNYTWYGGISKLLKAASGMSGVPMAAVTREIITGWNSIIQYMAPDLVVRTYDPGDKSTIKYAYLDGYLTDDEAYKELLNKGIAKDDNDAYWTVQEWGGGDDYSKYDEINQAVRNGEDIKKQMAELTSHGHTEKQVVSNIKSSVGKWYQDGEITSNQAVTMLTRYTGLTSGEANAAVNKWKCKVETGIAFDEIKDSFMSGETSYSRAIDMNVKYGGISRQEATEKVYTWGFIKKHPGCEDISYSAIENYETYCERTGMNAKVFYDAWKYNYSAKADKDASGKAISGSKRDKVCDYIDKQVLTKQQKDALYLAFGYSEKNLEDTPWH
ncbi:MAG: SNF2-related protein [Clostridiales bacterium]|nr:SNF2-related protein [Clostridiales bacterium]